jgi:hypothetical protein
MAFKRPTTGIKGDSKFITGRPPKIPEMAHGGHHTLGHPSAKNTGSIRKPK